MPVVVSYNGSHSSDEPTDANLVQAFVEEYPDYVSDDDGVTENNFLTLLNEMVESMLVLPVLDRATARWKQEIGAALLPYAARYFALDEADRETVSAAFTAAIDGA